MIDTHCHLTHPRFEGDRDAALARARAAGVSACVTIGTGTADATRAAELAREHPGVVFATAGIDPFSAHEAGERFDAELASLTHLLEGGGFHAVGEIGLDYHYDLDARPVQADRLERQLEVAERLDLPVVIHVREAHDDMAAILRSHPRNRGVIHSFTGTPGEAEQYLDCGWSLAFNGVITFRNADGVREAARFAPLDRLLIETDSPYLAPVPRRGERCEPAYVAHTLAALAKARAEAVDEVAAATTENAIGLFRLPRGEE